MKEPESKAMRKTLAKRILTAFLLLVALAPVSAQRPDQISPLICDLNGDGQPEVVAIRPFVQDGVELGQLVVRNQQGDILWAGPAHSANPSSPQEPEIFLGEYDLGDLEAVGDFFGNGKVMLLGTYQKSDVRPTRFRMFEWDGTAFVHRRSGSLLPAPQRPATFVWSEDPGAGAWIESVLGFDGRLFRATLTDLRNTDSVDIMLSPRGEEFVLTIPSP